MTTKTTMAKARTAATTMTMPIIITNIRAKIKKKAKDE